MTLKERILDSWIMMEQLAEGDIKAAIKFDSTKAKYGFSSYFRYMLKKRYKQGLEKNSKANPGILFYLDSFKFKTIVDIICKEYHLDNLQDEMNIEQLKFGILVAFDKKLKLQENQTFVTMSEYLIQNNELSNNKSKFKDFEKGIKEQIIEIFDFQNKNLNKEEFDKKFNEAFKKLLTTFSHEFPVYWKFVRNIESTDINLHSFFIDDLRWAKKEDSARLDRYLNGLSTNNKINLDPVENIEAFKLILQPKNYPMGHFMSKFPASLMQQVAINLALNDRNDIRTVNGPPGTGKTTLLKDIFADLLVQQAKAICDLPKKNVYSPEDSKVGQTKLPDSLANKGIVVASSNNGAVKNIVDELPQLLDKDSSFKEAIDKLEEIDYFSDIANKDLKKPKYWGLFSLEGGSKGNISTMMTKLREMVEYLKENQDKSDPNVYDDFIKQYNKVKTKQNRLQDYSKFLEQKNNIEAKKTKYNVKLDKNGTILSSSFDLPLQQVGENISNLNKSYDQISSQIQDVGFLGRLFNKAAISENEIKREQLKDLNQKINQETSEKHQLENKLERLQNDFYNYVNLTKKYQDLKVKNIPNYDRDFSNREIYDDFEEETYWYDSNDLKEESILFVLALQVRKQFLFENYKSLNAALFNWNKQDKELKDTQEEITLRSWQWINFAIPIISTTFASFHTMFRNLPEDSVANLFIDEAGQAVPQSVVGVLLRSKKIMAVGDPAQIKPVNTLDGKIISFVGEYVFGLNKADANKYVSGEASVQTIMDQASQYGYFKDLTHEEWIGIPLWVHRRCLNPMFNISNAISYNNKMVLPKMIKEKENQAIKVDENTGRVGAGRWINVGGRSDNKFVENQAIKLNELIDRIKSNDQNPFSEEDIFIITPFKNVANKLRQEIKGIKKNNIGTVHTFQGRENKIVFLVLGASKDEEGAARWAVTEPNIINVAATRAKIWFFIIGDKDLYQEEIGTDTIIKTNKAFDDYNKKMENKEKENPNNHQI